VFPHRAELSERAFTLNQSCRRKAKIDKYSTSPLTRKDASGDGKRKSATYGVGAGEDSLDDDGSDEDEEEDSDGAAVADGEASEVASVFFAVEDFFEGEADASALALELELFFVVLDVLVPEVPDFFVVEEALVPVVVEVFFFAVVVLAVVELAVVSFLFAHPVTNASAARTAIKQRTDFFIGVRGLSLSQLGVQAQAFNRASLAQRHDHNAQRNEKRADK
jgi:hypothetical protein